MALTPHCRTPDHRCWSRCGPEQTAEPRRRREALTGLAVHLALDRRLRALLRAADDRVARPLADRLRSAATWRDPVHRPGQLRPDAPRPGPPGLVAGHAPVRRPGGPAHHGVARWASRCSSTARCWPGRNVFRTLFYLPIQIPLVASTLVWIGVLNAIDRLAQHGPRGVSGSPGPTGSTAPPGCTRPWRSWASGGSAT